LLLNPVSDPFGPQQGGNLGFPPGPPQPSGPVVTVFLSGRPDLDINPLFEKLKQALKTGYCEIFQSGGEARIKLGFAGEVQTVIDAIDLGKVESSDPAKREVRVKID
jgi:hypothetical protein